MLMFSCVATCMFLLNWEPRHAIGSNNGFSAVLYLEPPLLPPATLHIILRLAAALCLASLWGLTIGSAIHRDRDYGR